MFLTGSSQEGTAGDDSQFQHYYSVVGASVDTTAAVYAEPTTDNVPIVTKDTTFEAHLEHRKQEVKSKNYYPH